MCVVRTGREKGWKYITFLNYHEMNKAHLLVHKFYAKIGIFFIVLCYMTQTSAELCDTHHAESLPRVL